MDERLKRILIRHGMEMDPYADVIDVEAYEIQEEEPTDIEDEVMDGEDVATGEETATGNEATTEEDTETGEEADEDREGTRNLPSLRRELAIMAAVAALCFALMYSFSGGDRSDVQMQTTAEEDDAIVSVTERETERGVVINVAPENKAQTEAVEQEETSEETEKQEAVDAWQDVIFGSTGESVMASHIKVTGLTENEKNLTGFRESDFIRSLSAFLSANNLKTRTVTFEGTVACSAGQAAAYEATLSGIEDKKLLVLFYPDYEGRYIFSLMDADEAEEEETVQTETQHQSETQVTQQNVQPVQTAPVQVTAPEPETQAEYDAMRLTVTGLDTELSNYMANTYELQYELYDYLYGKGIKNATRANVTDYYIDSVDRTASIQITVSGVGNVTAIYDRDSNSYSFR